MEAVGGEGGHLPLELASQLRQQIVSRELVPGYMIASEITAFRSLASSLVDKFLITLGWLQGERFITPAPIVKFRLEKNRAEIVRQWEMQSVKDLPDKLSKKSWVLYAMQMQPESNLDVWGYPWNDQAALILRAAVALEKIGAFLVVKPNPKSKYELSHELLEVIRNLPNLVALSHETKMDAVFPKATAVLSVTGTIILECVMSAKPVAVLGDHALAKLPGVNRIREPEEVANLLVSNCVNSVKTANESEAIDVLRMFYRCSYPGVMYEPLSQPHWGTEDNHDVLANSFSSVIKFISTGINER